MDTFQNLWQIAFGERIIVTPQHQDYTEPDDNEQISIDEEKPLLDDVIEAITDEEQVEPITYQDLEHSDPEIRALQKNQGKVLVSGMTLEYTLHELLDLIPKTRKKCDAYKGLKRKLHEQYGVELIINSKIKKK